MARAREQGDDVAFDEKSRPTETVEFDYVAVTLRLYGVAPDQWAEANTKDKATALLKAKGVPQDASVELLSTKSFDDPEREREAQQRIARLGIPENKTPPAVELRAPKEPRYTLSVLLAQLHEKIHTPCRYTPALGELFRDHWKGTPAERRTALLSVCPAALLDEHDGPDLVKALADLLEAERWGDCARRVPKLLPVGTRRKVATAARKALAILRAGKPGAGLTFDAARPEFAVDSMRRRIVILRRWWNHGDRPPSKEVRLKKLRELHPKELKRISKKNLIALLTKGDPLTAACRLAEHETGVSWKVFKRAFSENFRSPAA